MKASDQPNERVAKSALLASLPPTWPQDLTPAIQEAIVAAGKKVVVFDDDPTGTQSVFGIPVLADWSVPALTAELANDLPAFYILTNSRSLPLEAAQALSHEIGNNLLQAGRQSAREFVMVSRSDSTLRGHFAGEIEALEETFENFDGVIVAPFFEEGGRLTIHDVHYVEEGDWLVPVGKTQFAHDPSFGFRSSNLREWIAEKYKGDVPAEAVSTISLEDIRRGGPEKVKEILMGISYGSLCVVNAACRRDLEVVIKGLLDAEAGGRHFLYRTAASFVAVRAGLASRPLLAAEELDLPAAGGGLIVIGSYIAKTSEQLNHLLLQSKVQSLEVHVDALLAEGKRDSEIKRIASAATRHLENNEDVVIFTSRLLKIGRTSAENLDIHHRVSEALVSAVRAISARPRYVLAKGGITSSDVATKALGVKRAMVLGQIAPGVPVWKLGSESVHPDLNYIVFPGNVGGPDAISDTVNKLSRKP